MSFRNFLSELEEKDELIQVNKELSPEFEIPRELNKNEDKALIFNKIKNHDMKVAGNICGARNRIAKALGVEREELIPRLREAHKNPRKPNKTSTAPIKENEIKGKPNLEELPILTHFEKDGGPYVTSSILVAKDEDGNQNLSFHRMKYLGGNKFAVRLVPRNLHKMFSKAEERDEDLSVAAVIGVHPAVSIAAASSPPYGFDEYSIAGALLEELELTDCDSLDLEVPAGSEIVLEGKLVSGERAPEGPFADITGTYDAVREEPVFEVDSIMMRSDAIYQAILPSSTEHQLLMGMPREPLIFEELEKVVNPNNVRLTPGGGGWLHGVISIKKENKDDGKKAIESALKAHSSMKHVVIVDNDINIYDSREVEWAIATRARADRDVIIKSNVKGSSLDPTADPETRVGSKMGIDATIDLGEPNKFKRAKIPK
ncbi:MAG: UbiD family decarboxylase [Hadesarchaea archaeon]|nr:UbiD family decarboxylase [Hadesarchaea archaeon]